MPLSQQSIAILKILSRASKSQKSDDAVGSDYLDMYREAYVPLICLADARTNLSMRHKLVIQKNKETTINPNGGFILNCNN